MVEWKKNLKFILYARYLLYRLLCQSTQMSSKAAILTTLEKRVFHDQSNSQFYILLPQGGDQCVLMYQQDGCSLDLWHTEVPLKYRGQGLGGDLTRAAMDWVKENKYKARLSCTFIQKYVRENPNNEWDGLLIIE